MSTRLKKDGTPYKKPEHIYQGRVKNVEVNKGLFTFELARPRYERKTGELKSAGGLTFKQKGKRKNKAVTLSFEQIANGGATEVDLYGGEKWQFLLTEKGLQVRRKGEKNRRVIPYEELCNSSRRQPLLFSELATNEGDTVAPKQTEML